jgi:hypothetical protein
MKAPNVCPQEGWRAAAYPVNCAQYAPDLDFSRFLAYVAVHIKIRPPIRAGQSGRSNAPT